jgi:hypothetical protein
VIGAFYQALLNGVWAQWLIDPARAPSARDLAGALQFIARAIQPADMTPDAAQQDG